MEDGHRARWTGSSSAFTPASNLPTAARATIPTLCARATRPSSTRSWRIRQEIRRQPRSGNRPCEPRPRGRQLSGGSRSSPLQQHVGRHKEAREPNGGRRSRRLAGDRRTCAQPCQDRQERRDHGRVPLQGGARGFADHKQGCPLQRSGPARDGLRRRLNASPIPHKGRFRDRGRRIPLHLGARRDGAGRRVRIRQGLRGKTVKGTIARAGAGGPASPRRNPSAHGISSTAYEIRAPSPFGCSRSRTAASEGANPRDRDHGLADRPPDCQNGPRRPSA